MWNGIGFILNRYLRSGKFAKKAKLSAPISIGIPLAGVAVGVCFFVVVLSVMNGFVTGLKGRLLGFDAHIEVVNAKGFGNLEADEELLNSIAKINPGIVGVSPFIKGDIIVTSAKKPSTVMLLGIDPNTAEKTTQLVRFLERSSRFDMLKSETNVYDHRTGETLTLPSVLLGKDLAVQMSAETFDRVTLLSIVGQEGPGGVIPVQQPVGVAETFSSGSTVHDSKLVVTSLALAQTFFDMENQWSGIQVAVKDPFQLDGIVKELDEQLKSKGLRAKTWEENNKSLMRALKLERWGMRFVLSMVILVGCFSITITLVLAVKRKRKEMAVLRALGMSRLNLGLLYVFIGTSVGALGMILGQACGAGVLWYLKRFPLPFVPLTQGGKPLPVLVSWDEVLFVSIGSVVMAALAALWPAMEVMSIDVVDTLSDRTL
jgi:lipoprotein-releasing system permease protein